MDLRHTGVSDVLSWRTAAGMLGDPLYRNSFFMAFTSVFNAGCGFFWMIAARLYTVEQVGLATALISALGLVVLLSRLGFDVSAIRFFPRDKKGQTFQWQGSAMLFLLRKIVGGSDLLPKCLLVNNNSIKKIILICFSIIIYQIFGMLFMLILARICSKSDYGEISYVIAVGIYGATLVTAGLPAAYARFISKHRENKKQLDTYFSNIFTITLGSVLLLILTGSSIYKIDIKIILIIIGCSITYIYLGIIRGLMNYKKIMFFNILSNLLKLIFLIVASYVFLTRNLLIITLIYALSGLIVIAFLESVNHAPISYNIMYLSRDVLKEVSVFSVPVIISTLAYNTISTVPVIFIRHFHGYDLVGLYSVAMTFMVIFGFISNAITTITMPEISYVENNRKRIEYTVQSIKIVLVTGILIYIFIIMFGELIIQVTFTEKYIESYPILIVLSIGSIAASIRNVFSALWEGSGYTVIAMRDIVSASIICILLSIILIPPMGPLGGAYAYTIGFLVAIFIDLYHILSFNN